MSRLLTFVPIKPPGAGNGSPFCATQASACRELYALVMSSESWYWKPHVTRWKLPTGYRQFIPADNVVVLKSDVEDVYCVMSWYVSETVRATPSMLRYGSVKLMS